MSIPYSAQNRTKTSYNPKNSHSQPKFQFQGWDPTAADWHATKGEGGLWTFEAPLSTCPCGSKFKFVVNDIDWMQPDAEKTDPKYLTDDGFGGFNLQMACE